MFDEVELPVVCPVDVEDALLLDVLPLLELGLVTCSSVVGSEEQAKDNASTAQWLRERFILTVNHSELWSTKRPFCHPPVGCPLARQYFVGIDRLQRRIRVMASELSHLETVARDRLLLLVLLQPLQLKLGGALRKPSPCAICTTKFSCAAASSSEANLTVASPSFGGFCG